MSRVEQFPSYPAHGEERRAYQAESVQPHPARGLWQRWHIGALLSHVALSVCFTWPLVLNFLPGTGTQTPGTLLVDRDQNLWNLWWVRYALLHGHNPFVTDMIYYPTPVSLYYHTLNLFNGLLAIPLLSVFTLSTTYNLIVLFSFVASGYGAYLLVHYICHNNWAAMVGSVVFAYSAYHLATMRGLLQLISLEWVPFFVLCLLRACFDSSPANRQEWLRWAATRALPAALMLLLVALVDWYYTMYMLMFAGLLAVYLAIRGARQASTETLRGRARAISEGLARSGFVILLFLVLVSPVLIPTVSELGSSRYMVPTEDAALSFSADLLAFFQPPREHQLWGKLFSTRAGWPFGNNEYEVYLTYTVLVLAGVAIFASRNAWADTKPRGPGRSFWIVCGLLFFSLALGPVLQVNGTEVRWLFSQAFELPMPYRLVESLPVLNISRSPDRFDMPLTLCLAVLSGYGMNVLLSKPVFSRAPQGRSAILGLGVIVLIIFELWPMPYPQRSADIPAWYKHLGVESGDFSILELPPQNDYWHGAFRMRFQTAHEKHTFGGYISREYPHPFVESTPGFQEMFLADGVGDMLKNDPKQWISALNYYKVRYIVLQKERLSGKVDPFVDVTRYREAIGRVLGIDGEKPQYADEFLEAYRVNETPSPRPFLSIGAGWQPREVGPNGAFRWMGSQASLAATTTKPTSMYLVFKVDGLGPPRPLQVSYDGQVIFEGDIEGLREVKIGPLKLSAGNSIVDFSSPGGTSSPADLGIGSDPRQISFAVLDAHLESAGP